MPPHNNRSKLNPSPARNPKSEEVLAARVAAGLTQAQAAAVVYVTLNGWQRWEYGERPMHPAFWALFRLRVGMLKLSDLP